MEIRHSQDENEHVTDAAAARLNISTWFGRAVVFNLSENTGKNEEEVQYVLFRAVILGESAYVTLQKSGGFWGSFGLFYRKAGKEGEGRRGWSRGRIWKVRAHRFKEDPDVYCCIWRAAFGTYLVLDRVCPQKLTWLRRKIYPNKCFSLP